MSFAPPKVSRRLRDETARREATAFLGLTTDDGSAWWRDWNRDLEAFMPGLRLCFAPDPCPVDATAIGARPGRWGLLFPSVMGSPRSVSSFSGPNDELVEPGAWVFDWLRENDWQNPLVRRDRQRALEAAERAKAKREQVEHEERTEDILERYLAVSRVQVSMSTDTPWSQNAAGRRGVRR